MRRPAMSRPHPTSLPASANRLRLRVTAAAEQQIRAGHPWVFSESIRKQNRAGLAGELGVVFDRADKFLAVGFFDPGSPIRLRILHTGKPLTIDAAFWRDRLAAALGRRAGLFDEHTTGYRVINGESDGWPGLVLDRYAQTLVLKVYTAAWLPQLGELLEIIRARMAPQRIVLRLSRNLQLLPGGAAGLPHHPGPRPPGAGESPAALSPVWRDGAVVFPAGDPTASGAPVAFLESGLRFEADVQRGQKTGFFLDQRENRRFVESLARGRTMLNAFSFSGGFSVYAARGGAKAVTDLDISQHALESARRNVQLNWPGPPDLICPHESIQTDAFAWLAENRDRQFDLVVLDPPSLAKREVERAGAIRAYGRLVTDGLRHLAPAGILVACSCSAHVSAEEFFAAARAAARASGRRFAELQLTRHPPDHPADFREAGYLKGIYLRF